MNAPIDPQSPVRLHVKDQVATVLLNRPERHNSLVPELLTQLIESFREIKECEDAKVVVLRAAGQSFSTGGDLDAFRHHREDIESFADQLVGALNEAIKSIIECDLPVVTAVDGQVTGGSFGLVLASDIVVVTDRAAFTPYYVDVGFSPDGGWTAILPEIIGHSRAAAVQLLNDTISAQQALDWGIAYQLTQADQLDRALDDICARIIDKKSGSVRATKRLLRRVYCVNSLDAERKSFIKQIANREAVDGVDDFIAQRM